MTLYYFLIDWAEITIAKSVKNKFWNKLNSEKYGNEFIKFFLDKARGIKDKLKNSWFPN
jgi:hypothetical protein